MNVSHVGDNVGNVSDLHFFHDFPLSFLLCLWTVPRPEENPLEWGVAATVSIQEAGVWRNMSVRFWGDVHSCCGFETVFFWNLFAKSLEKFIELWWIYVKGALGIPCPDLNFMAGSFVGASCRCQRPGAAKAGAGFCVEDNQPTNKIMVPADK